MARCSPSWSLIGRDSSRERRACSTCRRTTRAPRSSPTAALPWASPCPRGSWRGSAPSGPRRGPPCSRCWPPRSGPCSPAARGRTTSSSARPWRTATRWSSKGSSASSWIPSSCVPRPRGTPRSASFWPRCGRPSSAPRSINPCPSKSWCRNSSRSAIRAATRCSRSGSTSRTWPGSSRSSPASRRSPCGRAPWCPTRSSST